MSDREIIIESLAKAEARIRTNRLIGRIASALSVFIAIAVCVTTVNLFVPLGRTVLGSFWIIWLAALTAYVVRGLGTRKGLSEAAADVDRQARLKDEVVSAYWFLSQNADNPWIDLQIRRAAATVRGLDIPSLYPRIIPPTSYFAAGGLVLLVALNLAPVEPGANNLFSIPPPEVDVPLETEGLFDEIEELLDRAEELQPSESIQEFQALLEALKNSEIGLVEAEEQMEDVESLIDEGNLTVAAILEGLEEVGEDLQQSEDTEAAGKELVTGNLDEAASELEELAEEIGTGREPAPNLADALTEAAENRRPGLEELANQLEAGAVGAENENPEEVEQALTGAADSLNQLADIIESQQLQNEAAARMDELQDTLAQAQVENEGLELDLQNDPTTPNDEVETPFIDGGGDPQPGQGEIAGNEEMPGQDISGLDSESDGEAGAQAGEAPGQNPESLNSNADGFMPIGFGYSPAINEGAATSLEVQLQEELVEVQIEEIDSDTAEDPEELSSRMEASTLDYRNVPSDLTPAQQDLLNPDRIPREYQNLIKQYFEAIRTDQ